MQKIIGAERAATDEPSWLTVEQFARVTVSSEDPGAPVEAALESGGGGWRAAEPGEQSLRITFDGPRAIRTVEVVFEEAEHERVQEFLLEWSNDGGQSFRPIVRQQFTFSPGGATRESERYQVSLTGATDLRIRIVPDISGRPHPATLRALRVG